MSNTGLSNLTFMDGLMKGASFVNSFQQQKRANDIEDEKLAMAKTTHGQQTKLNDLNIQKGEEDQLLRDFDRDIRALSEAGRAPDKEFWKKYNRLGLGQLESEEAREKWMSTGTLLHRAVANDQWDEKALDAFNNLLGDDLKARTQRDGLGRRIVGVKELPTGRDDDGDGAEDTKMVPILEVTRKDGTKYEAPLTVRGTSDDDDELFTVDDKKLNEWYEVGMHRANMAYNLQRHKNDPKAFNAALREIVLGKAGQKEAYEVRDIYDDNTGTKRAAAIRKSDAQFSHWLGGASENDGRGGSGSGRGSKAGSFDVDGYLKMQQEIRTSANFTTPEERAAAAAEVDRDIAIKWGVPPAVVLQAHQLKRQSGDYSELTHEDVAQVMAGIEARQRAEAEIDNTMAANPEAFGRPGLTQVDSVASNAPPASPPPSPQFAQAQSDVIDTAMAELERIQGVINNPDAKPAERREAQKLRAQIFKDMKPKERQMVEAQLKRQRTLAKERGAEEQMAAEIATLQQRLSNPEGYRTDIERAVAQRKLIELLEKRAGKSNTVAGL